MRDDLLDTVGAAGSERPAAPTGRKVDDHRPILMILKRSSSDPETIIG